MGGKCNTKDTTLHLDLLHVTNLTETLLIPTSS